MLSTTKICTNYNNVLNLEDFQSLSNGNLSPQCRTCSSIYWWNHRNGFMRHLMDLCVI